MNCPTCGEENLIGAKICAACGRSMRTQPPPRPSDDYDSMPRGPDAAPSAGAAALAAPHAKTDAATTAAPAITLCRVCLEGFEPDAATGGGAICPRCRGGPQDDVPRTEPAFLPATQFDARGLPMLPRMKAVEKRASLRPAVVWSLWGAGLVVAGAAAALAMRERDPLAAYFADAKPERATFDVVPSRQGTTRIESTMSLDILHEMVRASFSSRLEDVLRIDQKSVQDAEIAWVRDDEKGVVVDSLCECRVAQQTGTGPAGADGRELSAYPWEGHRATVRLLVPPSEPERILGGDAPLVGCDVPPFLTVRDVGAPSGAVTPGETWKTSVTLPLFASKTGGLLSAAFPCTVTYVGARIQGGVPSYVLSLKGAAPKDPPAELGDMNRTAGSLRAALFFDAKTGFLVEAHAVADVSAWIEKGRIEDRVRLSGTVEAKRK